MKTVSGIGKESRARLAEIMRQTNGTVTVAQAAKILRLPAPVASKLLSRWTNQGWLSRVRQGLYVPVPLEARTPEVALEDPWIIAEQLFSPCYIGGWSAAEYWGLTEQLFRTIVVMTTRKPRDRKPSIRGTDFLVRTIPEKALFGTKPVWRGKVKVNVSDQTRTVLDMLNDPSLGGGIRPTVDVFKSYLGSQEKDTGLLISYADRLGNGAVFKRLGFLAERIAKDDKNLIEACRSRLSAGNAKLDPALPSDRLITTWKLWVPAAWAKEKNGD